LNPTRANLIGRQAPSTVQERGREVDAGNLRSSFNESERMPSMATTDVNHMNPRHKMQEVPEAAHFQSNGIG
jgi:hypothetical protein